MDVQKLLRRAEDLRAVDGVASALADVVRRTLKRSRLDGVLRGSWLGHPVHPVMVTAPIGAWVCAAAFDLMPGNQDAARKLVALGLAATPPVVLLGLADYADLDQRQRRVGVTHMMTNALATAIFTASYVSRRRGAHLRGQLLGFVGLMAVGAGGALGGHLSYAQGAGVHRW